MSDKKKTQKQLIEDLTKAVEKLTKRIEALERQNNPYDWPRSPRPTPRTKKCPRCNGTGVIDDDDYRPYPYYDGNFYNGTV